LLFGIFIKYSFEKNLSDGIYKIQLKKYPEIIIQIATTPKKIKINFKLITFFKSVASGIESPTTAIMNASDVPIGMPFETKTWIIGSMPVALPYIGTHRITANGIAYQESLPMYFSKKDSGR
jgi:hypothetical protein